MSRSATQIPSVSELLAHHHEAGQPLVRERGEAEQALGLGCVRRVERVEREDQDVRQDLPGREERDRKADAARAAELPAPRRIDELRPDEHAGEHEGDVLEVVDDLMRERVVVGGGHVPRRDDDRPEREGDHRPQQEAEDGAQRADARERPENARPGGGRRSAAR